MKIFITIIGLLFILISSVNIGKYQFDIRELSNYGKGFVFGNIIIFAIGCALLYWAMIKKKKAS